MLSQVEQRIAGQISFAEASDSRATTVTGVATTLAAASAGVFAVAVAELHSVPLAAGTFAAAAGFTVAAWRALQSVKTRRFHPLGYLPSDFLEDIAEKRSIAEIQSEMLADYGERLTFNSDILAERSDCVTVAFSWLIRTPVAAACAALLAWGLSKAF